MRVVQQGCVLVVGENRQNDRSVFLRCGKPEDPSEASPGAFPANLCRPSCDDSSAAAANVEPRLQMSEIEQLFVHGF